MEGIKNKKNIIKKHHPFSFRRPPRLEGKVQNMGIKPEKKKSQK